MLAQSATTSLYILAPGGDYQTCPQPGVMHLLSVLGNVLMVLGGEGQI